MASDSYWSVEIVTPPTRVTCAVTVTDHGTRKSKTQKKVVRAELYPTIEKMMNAIVNDPPPKRVYAPNDPI